MDFSGANFLAIIEQRYESLRVLREEERLAARRAQLLLEEKERLEREAREEYSLKKTVPGVCGSVDLQDVRLRSERCKAFSGVCEGRTAPSRGEGAPGAGEARGVLRL